jgi:hypothetical protein
MAVTIARTKVPTLSLLLAGTGASYFALTLAQKPRRFADHATSFDLHTTSEWERHMRDAKFALLFGLGAGGLLWWLEER